MGVVEFERVQPSFVNATVCAAPALTVDTPVNPDSKLTHGSLKHSGLTRVPGEYNVTLDKQSAHST